MAFKMKKSPHTRGSMATKAVHMKKHGFYKKDKAKDESTYKQWDDPWGIGGEKERDYEGNNPTYGDAINAIKGAYTNLYNRFGSDEVNKALASQMDRYKNSANISEEQLEAINNYIQSMEDKYSRM